MPSTVHVLHLLAQNQEQLQGSHLILDKVKIEAVFCNSVQATIQFYRHIAQTHVVQKSCR